MCASDSPRIQRQRPTEGFLRAGLAVRSTVHELPENAVAAAETRPRRRESRIELHASPVQIRALRRVRRTSAPIRSPADIARRPSNARAHPVSSAAPLVSGSASASTTRRAMSSCRWNRSPERRLHGMRRQQRAAGRLDELGRRAQLIAGAQQRPRHDAIDVRFGRRAPCRSGASPAYARRNGARAEDERTDPRERSSNCVRQAECEKVGLRIRPQHAERQHHEPRERVREGMDAQSRRCRVRRAVPPPSPRPTRVDPRDAWRVPAGSRGPRPRRPVIRQVPAAARTASRAGCRRGSVRRTPDVRQAFRTGWRPSRRDQLSAPTGVAGQSAPVPCIVASRPSARSRSGRVASLDGEIAARAAPARNRAA